MPNGEPTFDGQSTELKRTQIVATLDEPIEQRKNCVWCASFQSAWKAVQKDLIDEELALAGAGQVPDLLNDAPDPRPTIPEAALYVAAGWNHEGIIEQIQRELAQRFPSASVPKFPGIPGGGFVAYSYLEANVKFSLPYNQNRHGMAFTSSDGQKTNINSFGIRPEDFDAYEKLRAQPRILFRKLRPQPRIRFRKPDPRQEDLDFAIDLCRESSPSQIVVARIPWQPSLASCLRHVQQEIARFEESQPKDPALARYHEEIGPADVLLVPDIFWKISHGFSELEGKVFENRKLKGQRIDVAEQDILFRLDRSGAELKSEALFMSLGAGMHFVLNQPFLVYMKKRDADTPFFAMWVDNAELLQKWK